MMVNCYTRWAMMYLYWNRMHSIWLLLFITFAARFFSKSICNICKWFLPIWTSYNSATSFKFLVLKHIWNVLNPHLLLVWPIFEAYLINSTFSFIFLDFTSVAERYFWWSWLFYTVFWSFRMLNWPVSSSFLNVSLANAHKRLVASRMAMRIGVSKKQCKRYMKKLGFRAYRDGNCQLLTEKHKKDRVKTSFALGGWS